MAFNTISVIVPAYNEKNNLVHAVTQTMETLDSLGLEYEVIIVNDHSDDNTGEIAEELAARHKKIRCFHNAKNLGSGGSFRWGIENARLEYVIFVPADNPLLPGDMAAYLPRMGICDIIVGVRVERVGYTGFAQFASFVYNRLMIPLLFNVGLSDVNWIQIYRRDLFGPGGIEIEHDGIFFLVEILIKAKKKRMIIAEVPAKMKKRVHGKPTYSRFSVMWRTFSDMMRFFFRLQKEKRRKRKERKERELQQ